MKGMVWCVLVHVEPLRYVGVASSGSIGAQKACCGKCPAHVLTTVPSHPAQAAVGKQNELRLCFETTLLDPALLQSVLAYYRLMAAWLMRLASPSTAAGAPPPPRTHPRPLFAPLHPAARVAPH